MLIARGWVDMSLIWAFFLACFAFAALIAVGLTLALYFAISFVVDRLRDTALWGRVFSRARPPSAEVACEPPPPALAPLTVSDFVSYGHQWVRSSDLYKHLERNVALWDESVTGVLPPEAPYDPPLLPSDVLAEMSREQWAEHSRLPSETGEEVLAGLPHGDFMWLSSICRAQLELPGGVRMVLINGGFRVKTNRAQTHYVDVLRRGANDWAVCWTPMWFPYVYDRGWEYRGTSQSAFRSAIIAAIDWDGSKETEPTLWYRRVGFTQAPKEGANE